MNHHRPTQSTPPTVLVTGSNRGIGQAIAKALRGRDCRVIRAAREVDITGPEDELPLDIADPASVKAASEWLLDGVDSIDVLVNNAGILLDEDTALPALTSDVLLDTLQVNLLGAFRLTNALLPLLRRSGHARVINVSSGLGQLSDPSTFAPAYSISKAALNALTLQQSLAFKKDGISVNAMCPGWVRTDMGGPSAERSPEQGADTAIWLALDADPSLTGKFFRDREEIPW